MITNRYSTYHLERLRRLLEDMLHNNVLTYEAAMDYAQAISHAYSIVIVPNKADIDATRAYANLQYHATHPGAVFANDTYTRVGVEMALRAVEREAYGGVAREKIGRIALPCAEFAMEGIAEALTGGIQ